MSEERQPTAEEARALLERDRRDRVARCQAAIQAALADIEARLAEIELRLGLVEPEDKEVT